VTSHALHSNQTIKPSLVKPNIARKSAAVQRLSASPRSIAPASLELARLARLSRGQLISLVVGQGRVVKLLIEQHIMVPIESPARTIVWCWRHCVLAVRARSGLVPVGVSWDYDAGKRADEEVGVYATGRFRGRSARGAQKPIAVCVCNML